MYWLVIEVQGEIGLISLQEQYLDQRLEFNPEEIVFYADLIDEETVKETDRLARAYGYEIGKGQELRHTIVMQSGNPFLDPNWRDKIKE